MKTDTTKPKPHAPRGYARPALVRTQPRCPTSFACPLCGGEATLTGRGSEREFVCLDCTAFDVPDPSDD